MICFTIITNRENIGRHNTARTIRCSPSILSQDRHVQLLNEVSIELIDLQKTIDDTTTTISTEHEEPCGMIIAHFDGLLGCFSTVP
jgi:hypothetical protein